jgi:hypothetical protein
MAEEKTSSGGRWPPGLALGIVIGVAIGVALDNHVNGIGVGVGLGLAFYYRSARLNSNGPLSDEHM